MTTKTSNPVIEYVCPACKRPLVTGTGFFRCAACAQDYDISSGIPDFAPETVLVNEASNYVDIRRLEFLAPVYEGDLWQSFILGMAGARVSSLKSIARFVSDTLAGVSGAILDAACGPATYGRRMAANDRGVYGVDFSMGTLRQGMRHIAREGVSGVWLARARVEELPFPDGVFNGAICCGSLHLFPDTGSALREIARTLKPGAPVAFNTFVAGGSLLARIMRFRRTMHVFELPNLRAQLAAAGFKDFQPMRDGDFLCFRVRKSV